MDEPHVGHIGRGDGEFSQAYKRVEDDGSYKTTCTDQCPDYLEWVSKGNTAEEAD